MLLVLVFLATSSDNFYLCWCPWIRGQADGCSLKDNKTIVRDLMLIQWGVQSGRETRENEPQTGGKRSITTLAWRDVKVTRAIPAGWRRDLVRLTELVLSEGKYSQPLVTMKDATAFVVEMRTMPCYTKVQFPLHQLMARSNEICIIPGACTLKYKLWVHNKKKVYIFLHFQVRMDIF